MKPDLAGQAFHAARFTLALGLVVGTVGASCAYAAQPGIPAQIAALQEDVQMLQQHVRKLIDQARTQNATTTQLTAIVNSQSQLIGLLQQQNQDLQARLGCMSKTGDDVYFTACNVHIVSGSGATAGAVNGLGNLIIGYNESAAIVDSAPNPASVKSGSHNLVVGAGHSYTSYGGLVAGWVNKITGPHSSITGGYRNTTFGGFTSISGGGYNEAVAQLSSIGGGVNNLTNGNFSSISGGNRGEANGSASSISGGDRVTVDVQNGWAAGTFISP